MKKNILIILGSPRRNGNSAILAEQVSKGANANGVNIETIYLHGMIIQPCQGCDSCQKNESNLCIIDDDMQTLYPKLKDADSIVIASPIYWFNFSAQTKIFIDRWYAVGIGERNIFTGKEFVLILTYADQDLFKSGAVNALRSFQDICKYNKASIKGMIYGSAYHKGEIENNAALMKKAYLLGKQLAAS